MDSHISTPTEFHLFPKLPTELRLRTWGFVPLEPQIVTQARSATPKRSCRRAPAVLHACHESRREFLMVSTLFSLIAGINCLSRMSELS
jgi:hypothetical protein